MTYRPTKQEQLHWLVDPDAITIRTEGPRLILRCGPYDSQESAFRCCFEDESPPKRRLGRLVRLLDLHLALEEKLRQLEDEDEDDAGN